MYIDICIDINKHRYIHIHSFVYLTIYTRPLRSASDTTRRRHRYICMYIYIYIYTYIYLCIYLSLS